MPIIDTHCHIDLYQNPHTIAEESERLGIITIAMTLLPSHFEIGFKHTVNYKKVRLALGMHPMKAEFHEVEFVNFIYYLDKTSYIGEIGLDFSKEGIETKQLQVDSFRKILYAIQGKRKIISLHSRGAENEVLRLLVEFGIDNAIFHWYTGSVNLINEIIDNGYFFSINPAMIRSANGKKIIHAIPKHRVLTESDGPFVFIRKEPIKPKNIELVIDYLSLIWKIPVEEVEKQIEANFFHLINQIK